MPLIILYLVVALAFFLGLQGLIQAFAPSEERAEVLSLRRKSLADGIGPWIGEFVRDFEGLVAFSNIGVSPARLLTVMATVTCSLLLSLYFFLGLNPLLSFGGSIIAGIIIPLMMLVILRRRHLTRLSIQLPEALDMLVRSLRVGHPVPIGISLIANNMPDPIGTEFRRVFDSMSYGLDLKEALEQMANRLQVTEIGYMVAAIRIQYATGGNLADILANLAEVMRERVRLRAKVKALTAETRVSANIMSVMPFFFVGGLYYMRPDFYQEVPNSPTLQLILGAAGGLLCLGLIAMRRIVNIRV